MSKQEHQNIDTKLAVIATDITWLRKEFGDFKVEIKNAFRDMECEMKDETKYRMRWQKRHSEEHLGLLAKLIAALVILTTGVSAFIGRIFHG